MSLLDMMKADGSADKLEPLPDYGDHMTMEDFVGMCKSGGFIDYDGHGNYATDKEMTTLIIQPSDVMTDNYRKDFSHVVWFNR